MKKIDMAKQLIKDNADVFLCPICGMDMDISPSRSLMCPNRHCFDLARQGYVNLLTNSIHTDYDKEMLESRNIICKDGFFDPVLIEIVRLLKKYNESKDYLRVLDAGCGEGSHTIRIQDILKESENLHHHSFGIDISKHGILIAAREYPGVIWCVADLAKLPFKKEKFDVILNILSPSNYLEFKRVLKDEGVLIKVVPESNYLKELRETFYDKPQRKIYSNDKIIKHFLDNFDLMEMQRVTYNAEINEGNIQHLVNMTPLSWGADEEKINKITNSGIKNVTVDLCVIVGRK